MRRRCNDSFHFLLLWYISCILILRLLSANKDMETLAEQWRKTDACTPIREKTAYRKILLTPFDEEIIYNRRKRLVKKHKIGEFSYG